jgi:hypothetical protein
LDEKPYDGFPPGFNESTGHAAFFVGPEECQNGIFDTSSGSFRRRLAFFT